MDYHKFADITIKKWQEKISSLGIKQSGNLVDSFRHQVLLDANGNLLAIYYTFLFYGHFVDMGVGKGVTLQDVGVAPHRVPKKWFSPVIFSEVRKLAELLGKEVSFRANLTIIEELQ